MTGPSGSDTESKSGYIRVDPPPPVADFTGSPRSGTAPLVVQFGDQSTGPITDWLWNFGDGRTSVARNPSHTYAHTGPYNVSLTVSGPGGQDTSVKAGYVQVTDFFYIYLR